MSLEEINMVVQKMLYGDGQNLVILIGEEDAEEVVQGIDNTRVLLINGFDWNKYLSPWPMEKVFKKGEDFGGQADELLEELQVIIFDARQQLNPTKVYLVGYSLAGLFSLYAATKLDGVDGVASVSGSMWFKDFVEYMRSNPVRVEKVYLSLGDAEKNTKNEVMAQVEDKTREVENIIAESKEVIFELNEGGHFNEPNQRVIKAINALINEK